MSLLNDPMVLRQIIMDHYNRPSNKGFKNIDGYEKVRKDSDTCIDDITVEMKIEDGIIKDVNFDGVACTISTASTDIMASLIENKTTSEAKEIIKNYYAMVKEQPFDENILGELVAFKNVSKQANRIKCATIGIDAMDELIK